MAIEQLQPGKGSVTSMSLERSKNIAPPKIMGEENANKKAQQANDGPGGNSGTGEKINVKV